MVQFFLFKPFQIAGFKCLKQYILDLKLEMKRICIAFDQVVTFGSSFGSVPDLDPSCSIVFNLT
jgi:hypothetical protein